MLRRSLDFSLFFIVIILAGSGCKKAEPNEVMVPATNIVPNKVAPIALKPATILRIHWIGKKRLAAETNAASFIDIWNMPEARKLENQSLNRLALALAGDGGTTNAVKPPVTATNVSPLRPILDDLLTEESYCEVRQAGGGVGELALAVRLGEDRTRLWELGLRSVLGKGSSIGEKAGSTAQWQLKNGLDGSGTLRLSRAGDWTLMGLGGQSNGLVAELTARIQRDFVPYTATATNTNGDWFTADLSPFRLNQAWALGLELPEDFPVFSLAINGDGDSVRTHALAEFPQPLPENMAPWNIPTNIIHDPLNSFTAVRGIGSWLSSQGFWKRLDAGQAPDQLFFWGQRGLPFLTYVAAPVANATNLLNIMTDKLLHVGNPWLDTNGIGKFVVATNFNGLTWNELTVMTPFLRVAQQGTNEFIFAGLESDLTTNQPAPKELLATVTGRTNLVFYDWELTGPRIDMGWLYFGQFLRFAVHRAQIPPKSASFEWLMAIAPRLGNSVTTVTKRESNQLVLGRRSAVGLTAAELNLLADWLESPAFPRGLNTMLGEPALIPAKRLRPHSYTGSTNSVPAPHK